MCRRDGAGVGARISVEQGAMPGGREQAAVVVLAVDFDQMAADLAQQRRRTGLVIEEGAAAAVGLHGAADQQRPARPQRDTVVSAKRRERDPQNVVVGKSGYIGFKTG